MGTRNGSKLPCSEFLKWCFSLRRLLNNRVSRCMSVLSMCVGCGQKESPLLNTTFSSLLSG